MTKQTKNFSKVRDSFMVAIDAASLSSATFCFSSGEKEMVALIISSIQKEISFMLWELEK